MMASRFHCFSKSPIARFVISASVLFALVAPRTSAQDTENRPSPSGKPTNVLLITVDTLRADHLHCYGYDRETSPNIDKLASEGAIFDRAMVPRSLTWPALASLMTSLYPVTHGVRVNGEMLDPRFLQLAEVFKKSGYSTAGFLANAIEQNWQGLDQREQGPKESATGKKLTGDILTESAISWMKTNQSRPFFLWVHYLNPHGPYRPPSKFDVFGDTSRKPPIDPGLHMRKWYDAAYAHGAFSPKDVDRMIGLYDGEIAFVDSFVGRLLRAVERTGLDDSTVIAFTSDHGEELYQHNRYFFHGYSPYEDVLQVPLIIKVPGVVEPGIHIPNLTEIMDVAPTLLQLTGLESPPEFKGTSLIPLLEGKPLDLGPAMGEIDHKVLSVRTEHYRYIFNPSEYSPYEGPLPYTIGQHELYDLRADPLELTNIASTEIKVLQEHQKLIDEWKRQWGWKLGDKPYVLPEMDDELREGLEALGYLGNN